MAYWIEDEKRGGYRLVDICRGKLKENWENG